MFLEKLILSEMPSNLDDLEKARYIYLMLGKYLSFSTKYQNTDYKEFYRMHEDDFEFESFDKNQIVCREWANLYSSFLTKFNIRNIVIKKGHHFVRFVCNNTIYVADGTKGPYTDLACIRYGDQTRHFGIAKEQELNIEDYELLEDKKFECLLELIDIKFPFYYNECIRFKMLKKQLNSYKNKKMNLKEKLELYFRLIGKLKEGYYESKNFIRALEKEMFTSEELERIHGAEMLRTNDDKEVDILQCIYITIDQKTNIYYLLAPNLSVRQVAAEEIKQLGDIGYTIYTRKIPGIVFSKEFIPGEISERSLSLDKSTFKMADYDVEQFNKLI